ncbi:MAG: DUF6057 family protein [Parabacteroides merdae]
MKTRIKFIYGICIIPILYGIAGPIVHLFAISALFFEFLTNGKKKYISIIYLLIAALSAIAGTYLGYSRNLTLAFLPEAYCNPLQTVSGIYYAWYALPMTMLLVAYLKRYKEPVSLKREMYMGRDTMGNHVSIGLSRNLSFWEIGCTAFHEAGLFAPDGTVGPCYQ